MKKTIIKKSNSVIKKHLEKKKAFKFSVFEYHGKYYVSGSLGEKAFNSRSDATNYCIAMLKTGNNFDTKK